MKKELHLLGVKRRKKINKIFPIFYFLKIAFGFLILVSYNEKHIKIGIDVSISLNLRYLSLSLFVLLGAHEVNISISSFVTSCSKIVSIAFFLNHIHKSYVIIKFYIKNICPKNVIVHQLIFIYIDYFFIPIFGQHRFYNLEISLRNCSLVLPTLACNLPNSSSSFPSLKSKSSSVKFAYFCLSLPATSFQFPLSFSEFI